MEQPVAPEMAAADVLRDGTLSVAAASAFTSLCPAELYSRMADGTLRYVRHGRRRLIPKRSLIEMLAAGLSPVVARPES